MSVRIEHHAEPIPGYRLIERLGGGGFGEVWKAEAPGGLQKAIKFVYGDLEAIDEQDGARAEQELKALSRVKTVHHPYILSLERFDIIEGQLIIVMELADRTVWDRFRECRAQGLPGIPRPELIGYMQETAEALDLMNNQYQLQHLDIKPQNLFLMHNHVKVADFGLVKDLEGMMASVTGGVTPVYAAPETFDGWVSRFSDQYSLAIVYQELVSGQRPFTGTTVRQLVLQHLQGKPNLAALPKGEQEVTARALAKNPDERFPNCLDFVQALCAASSAALSQTPASPPTLPEAPWEVQPIAAGPVPSRDTSESCQVHTPENALAEQATARFSRSDAASPLPASAPKTPASGLPERPRQGQLLPALVIGLGELGLGVLKRLKQEIAEHFGTAEALPHVGMCLLDTDPSTLQMATREDGEQALRHREVLLARLRRPSYYLKSRDGEPPEIEEWLNPKLLYRMSRQQTTGGLRALGRLAFVDNYRAIARRLEAELRDCFLPEPLQEAAERTGLGIHTQVPRIYVVAGLGGGTGSGMFIDLAYVLRSLARQLGREQAEIVGVFLMPSGNAPAGTPAWANTYAALKELDHFATAETVFRTRYHVKEGRIKTKTFTETGAPFERCLLFSLPALGAEGKTGTAGSAEHALARSRCLGTVAFTLFSELTSPLSRAAEQARRHGLSSSGLIRRPDQQRSAKGSILFQTVGLHRIRWPRRPLLQLAGRALCRRLVQRWMSKDSRPLRDPVQQWVSEQWSQLGLSQDEVIRRFQDACQKTLQQAPEERIAKITAPLLAPLAHGNKPAAPDGALRLATVAEVMAQLEQFVGVPEECRSPVSASSESDHIAGVLENTLAEASEAVVSDYEQKLAEIIVRLIEEPEYRLAGADEAIRQCNTLAEEALQHHEQLAKELQQRTAVAYQRLQAELDKPVAPTHSTPMWRTPFKRRGASTTSQETGIVDLVKSYAKHRYQSLILQQVTALYVCLRGQFSDQLREVEFCRARLGELAEKFAEPREVPAKGARRSATDSGASHAGQNLFPNGCRSLVAAVQQLEESIGAEQTRELDRRVQTLIRTQFKALVDVCMSSTSVLRNLAPAMLREVQDFLEARLANVNVTELLLQHHDAAASEAGLLPPGLREELKAIYDKAAPEPAFSAPAVDLSLLAVPEGERAELLRDFAKQALPAVRWIDAPGAAEILIYRERSYWSLAELDQPGSFPQIAYRKMSLVPNYSLHTRSDIPAWQGMEATV